MRTEEGGGMVGKEGWSLGRHVCSSDRGKGLSCLSVCRGWTTDC